MIISSNPTTDVRATPIFCGPQPCIQKKIIIKTAEESFMYDRLFNFSIMYNKYNKTFSLKGTTAKALWLHNVTTSIHYYFQIALYNKTIECGPGTVDVHVSHDVQDVGPPCLSLFMTKTYVLR